MTRLLLALLLQSFPLVAADVRDANKVVLGDKAGDCDCPNATPSVTATPSASPSETPSPSPTETPDPALDAIRELGFAAVWESPGVLLVTLSDESARFDTNRDELKPDAVDRLGKLAKMLVRFPGNSIRIDGHTDRNGKEAFNKRLSKARAERVRIVLTRMGVRYGSFREIEGWAAEKPLNTSMTPEGDAENRRVEIRVRFKEFSVPIP